MCIADRCSPAGCCFFHGERTFYACTLLQSIHIPAALPAIQESTFQNCAALETIDFSEDSKLTEIGRNTFRSCTALPAIVLPEGVTTIDINAFTDCTSLTKVVLPETITSVGTYLFSGCTALTDVTLSNALTKIPEECLLLVRHCNPFSFRNRLQQLIPWLFRDAAH